MIVYYKYIKSTYVTKNNHIIEMLFYIFKKHLRKKIIILHFNHPIILIFCFIYNKPIINKKSK